jgi:hypothetical protein
MLPAQELTERGARPGSTSPSAAHDSNYWCETISQRTPQHFIAASSQRIANKLRLRNGQGSRGALKLFFKIGIESNALHEMPRQSYYYRS